MGPHPTGALRCPRCGAPGLRVPEETPQALVKPEALARLGAGPHAYCTSESCPVVYFAPDGSRWVGTDALTVRVGHKAHTGPRTICYCFGHSVEEISREVHITGVTRIGETIRAKIRQGLCRCRTMNPTGRCCLADVDRISREAAAGAPPTPALLHQVADVHLTDGEPDLSTRVVDRTRRKDRMQTAGPSRKAPGR